MNGIYPHAVSDFHQGFRHIPLLRGKSLFYLAQTVTYQLSCFDVTVVYDVRVVDYVHVFTQLVCADRSIGYQDCVFLFSIRQRDADIKPALQDSFGIIQPGTDIQRPGVQVYIGRQIIQLCRVIQYAVFPQADVNLFGNAVSLLQ